MIGTRADLEISCERPSTSAVQVALPKCTNYCAMSTNNDCSIGLAGRWTFDHKLHKHCELMWRVECNHTHTSQSHHRHNNMLMVKKLHHTFPIHIIGWVRRNHSSMRIQRDK